MAILATTPGISYTTITTPNTTEEDDEETEETAAATPTRASLQQYTGVINKITLGYPEGWVVQHWDNYPESTLERIERQFGYRVFLHCVLKTLPYPR